MFHVFEALDELVAMIEEARGLPMSAQCMVPRSDALLLLDEIREAAELDLNLAMKLCLREVLLALVRQHKKIHPQTLSAAKDYGIDPQSFLRLP